MAASFVLAVDPGGTTGYACFEAGALSDRGELSPYEFEVLFHRYVRRPDATGGRIVVERFTITVATAKKSPQPDALKQIGAMEYLARSEAGLGLEMQTPAEAKNLLTDARLKTIGWYQRTPGGHVNDAMRHLGLALVKSKELTLPV